MNIFRPFLGIFISLEPDESQRFLNSFVKYFAAVIAGDGRQPHLTLVMGLEGGCWRCSRGKGDEEEASGGARAEDPVQLHSAARWWACRRGLCLQIRARRWDRGLEGVVGEGWGLQTWECQLPDSSPCATHVFQHILFHYAKPPFNIRMTELFISWARMIDMSYLWKPCVSSTGVWALLFSQQTVHMALFDTLFPDSDLACRRYQRGDLSHAIMAENKGDEVWRTKESKGSKGLEWKLITMKGEASTHWMPWYEWVSK